MSETQEPGRTVRVVCNWAFGLLLTAIVAQSVFLQPKPASEEEPRKAIWQPGELPLTLTATGPQNPIDGDRAMGYLRDICDLGPRISGSPAMVKQQEMIVAHFKPLADDVELQRFTAKHPVRSAQRVPLANLIARWRPAAPRRVMLCAHYDTRPLPDQDPNPRARRSGVCLGANDGASGAALLMELGHLMAEEFEQVATDSDFGVDFVLFDAEELVYSERDPYFLGSQWFGMQYKQRRPVTPPEGGKPVAWRYDAAVLVDMIGDADLDLYYEGHSYNSRQSRPICQEIWRVAEQLGVKEFKQRVRHTVSDDHLALRKFGGIRAIDIIDFDYPYWHTTGDTPDKCSGRSLAKVGWVLWEWLKERGGAKGA